MNQLNDGEENGAEQHPQSQPPQYFTFAFDPLAVTHRFDAILTAHFAQLPAAIPVGNAAPTTLSLAKAKLAQITASLYLLQEKTAALSVAGTAITDDDRKQRFEELQQLQRQIDAGLQEIENPAVLRRLRRVAHRRRRRRQRDKEHRDRRWRESAQRREEMAAAEVEEVERARVEAQVAEQSKRRKTATKPASQSRVEVIASYRKLLDRLAELHRVRCQQATRPTDATVVAEIAALQVMWRQADHIDADKTAEK